MEFRILGPLQVLDGGTPVEIAGSKRRAVLALLVLHANEVVRTDRLIDELWGEHAPRNASAALHSHVSRLRKALGPEVLARREWGYVLRADPDSIDLHRFERLVAAAEPLPARERSAKLAEALQLWRGPALSDLATESGLQTETARLDELRLTTLERRIDADLEAGRNAELVGEIEALIATHPLREHLRWQLILALYRAGRQAEALEVYRETRRVLTEELGLEPSAELKELEKAILRQDPAIAAVVPRPPPLAQPARRSKRRSVMLALLAVGAAGLGVGVALAVIDHTGSHRSAPATRAAASTSAAASTARAATRTSPGGASTQATLRERVPRPRASSHPHLVSSHAVVSTSLRQRPKSATTTSNRPSAATTHARPTAPTRTTKPKRPPAPKVVTISDNFDGNLVDPTIWYTACCDGTGVTVAEQGGQLQFAFAPDTTTGGKWNMAGGNFGTQCRFPGDFDARVDFTLPQWPPANGVVVSLYGFFGPPDVGYFVSRASSAAWGEQYSSWLGPGVGGGVQLPDTNGTLRVARKDGVLTTYFLHKDSWLRLGSRRIASRAAIGIGAGVGSGNGTSFGRQPVLVAFDNFTVTGADPICPPGTQGSG